MTCPNCGMGELVPQEGETTDYPGPTVLRCTQTGCGFECKQMIDVHRDNPLVTQGKYR